MRKVHVAVFAVIAALAPATVLAQDELDDMEMDVMEADETPNDASTRVLALPEEASDEARAAAQFGLDTANAAREGGAEFGSGIAESAREGGGGPPEGTPDGPPEGVPGPSGPGGG